MCKGFTSSHPAPRSKFHSRLPPSRRAPTGPDLWIALDPSQTLRRSPPALSHLARTPAVLTLRSSPCPLQLPFSFPLAPSASGPRSAFSKELLPSWLSRRLFHLPPQLFPLLSTAFPVYVLSFPPPPLAIYSLSGTPGGNHNPAASLPPFTPRATAQLTAGSSPFLAHALLLSVPDRSLRLTTKSPSDASPPSFVGHGPFGSLCRPLP